MIICYWRKKRNWRRLSALKSKLQKRQKGGKIVIEFYNNEDLDSLINKLI
ncbi:MAG: hypothetical protein ACP5IX_01770 [Patescibacteria group bacterium]